jgi:hypothetical protein
MAREVIKINLGIGVHVPLPLTVNSKSEQKDIWLSLLGFEAAPFGTLAHFSNHSTNFHPLVSLTEVFTPTSRNILLAISTLQPFMPSSGHTYCISYRQGKGQIYFTHKVYSETCERRTPLGRAQSVPNSEVSSIQGAKHICSENSSLGPNFTGCPHFAELLFTGFTVPWMPFCWQDADKRIH